MTKKTAQEHEIIPVNAAFSEALTARDVMNQVQAIQQLMQMGMNENEHYGVIPGTNSKPTLLKAGAEKLCLMFRLAPKFDIKETPMANGHKEIQIVCTLTHINTGAFWGQGVGSCSTMEKKYRYRSGVGASTGIVVPKDYWDLKRIGKFKEAQEKLGGVGYTTTKDKETGAWYIAEKVEGTENPDIADVYNTVLKIAKKRALVDATLTATAASDFFTQDLEENIPEPVSKPPAVDLPPMPVESFITHDEVLELFRLTKEKNVDLTAFRAYLKDELKATGTKLIKKEDYSKATDWIIQHERDGVES